MPRSMTGFARYEVQYSWGNLSCEIRSVNHRYLEPTIRLHESLRSLEPRLRDILRKQLSRGKIEANIFFKQGSADGAQLGLNLSLARQLADMASRINSEIANAAPIDTMDILRWPGVIQTAEADVDEVNTAANALFETTLKQLIDNRIREGEELAQFIALRLDAIAELVAAVREAMPTLLNQHHEKLRARLEVLKVEFDEERFQQELVYFAQKSDVAEELDRLDAHLTEVRHTLKQKGPIGRRLDFLMQELNREANTLSSKSIASETSQTAVDLKVFIEQMREQVQNIE